MSRLPETLVHARPMLALIHAAGLIFTNQFDKAEARLENAEGSVHADTPAEQARLILGWAAHCRAKLTMFSSGDLAGSIAQARWALDLLPSTRRLQSGTLDLGRFHTPGRCPPLSSVHHSNWGSSGGTDRVGTGQPSSRLLD